MVRTSTLTIWAWIMLGKLGQYYICWCLSSLFCQAISSHGIVKSIGRSLSFVQKNSIYLCYFSVEEWCKTKKKSIFIFLQTIQHVMGQNESYRQTFNIRRTSVGNIIFDHWRWSWSIACQRCSNYIFILNLTPGFNELQDEMRNIFLSLGILWLILEFDCNQCSPLQCTIVGCLLNSLYYIMF